MVGDVTIIGGADGPTSVFLASKVGDSWLIWTLYFKKAVYWKQIALAVIPTKEFVMTIPSPMLLVTTYKSNGKPNACIQSWATFYKELLGIDNDRNDDTHQFIISDFNDKGKF